MVRSYWNSNQCNGALETTLSEEMEKGTTKGIMFPIVLLTIATIALGLGAEGLHGYVQIAADSLLNPDLYIEAVFGDH